MLFDCWINNNYYYERNLQRENQHLINNNFFQNDWYTCTEILSVFEYLCVFVCFTCNQFFNVVPKCDVKK